MKTSYILSAAALAAILFSACQRMEGPQSNDSGSSVIELAGVSTDPLTRAVIEGGSFTTDEAAAGIGLFLLDSNGSVYGSNSGNVRYDFNSGKWTASEPLRVGSNGATLYGCYPYNSEVSDITAVPVSSSVNGTDFLYAEPAEVTSSTAKTVALTMQHALARLRIRLKTDASYVGDGILSAFSIEVDGIAAEGTLDAKTGAVTAAKAGFSVASLNESLTASGIIEDCLIVPAASSDAPQDVTMKFTIDGNLYEMNLAGDNAIKVRQGVQTDITLTVKNNGIVIDGASIGIWGEGGERVLTIGGQYKVTVKLAEAGGIAEDVMVTAYVKGESVLIRASSYSGSHLKCQLADGTYCPQSKTNSLVYTFTLSDISSDVTATIDYAQSVNVTAQVTPSGAGSVSIEGDCYPGETIKLIGFPYYRFTEWQDKDGNKLSDSNPSEIRLTSDLTVNAVFNLNLILPGQFSVSGSKKVRFSCGNLYWDGEAFGVEMDQYTSSDTMIENHLSHFYWNSDAEKACAKNYDSSDEKGKSDVFFTEKEGFTAGGSAGTFRTPTADEWKYLFDNHIYKYVRVCGTYGILILPDECLYDYVFDEEKDSYTLAEWSAAEAAGLVFLPGAGRILAGQIDMYGIGLYWSSTPSEKSGAYYVSFNGLRAERPASMVRSVQQSVRLVTEQN